MAKLLFLSSCGLPSHVAGPHRVCRKWLVFLKLHFSSHKSRLPNSRSSRVSLQTQDLSQTEKRMFMWKTKKICFLDFTFCWPCIMQWFFVNDQLDAQIPFYVLIFLFITLYMFRAHRAHHQERQIVSIQPLVTVTLCWLPCRVPPTQSDSYQRLYWYNLSLLMMSTMYSKHVESYILKKINT